MHTTSVMQIASSRTCLSSFSSSERCSTLRGSGLLIICASMHMSLCHQQLLNRLYIKHSTSMQPQCSSRNCKQSTQVTYIAVIAPTTY